MLFPSNISGSAYNPERILVRGTNWLGDAVMTTPALEGLRRRFPEARITLLTHRKLSGLWENQPVVDEVMIFEKGDPFWRTAVRLRRGMFDLALLLPNSFRAALEAWLAGIPVRLGRSSPWRRWLLTHPVPISSAAFAMPKRSPREVHRITSRALFSDLSKNATLTPPSGFPLEPAVSRARVGTKRHHRYQYLELTNALGCSQEVTVPRLMVDLLSESAVSDKFDLDPAVRWVGINAGAEYGPAKRWPAESFAACAAALLRERGCGLILLGGQGDVETASLISHTALTSAEGPQRIRMLAGKTSLKELCAVLKRCSVVLTNDTGPMHVAAAVGTPVVALFGSTSPEMTGPGLPDSSKVRVVRTPTPCAPCFQRHCPIDLRCLTRIDPLLVTRAVLEFLGEFGAPHSGKS